VINFCCCTWHNTGVFKAQRVWRNDDEIWVRRTMPSGWGTSRQSGKEWNYRRSYCHGAPQASSFTGSSILCQLVWKFLNQ
jgi:hypothetical protein